MKFEISFSRGGYRVVHAVVDEPKPVYFDKMNDNDKYAWVMANAVSVTQQLVKKDEWFPTEVTEVSDNLGLRNG